MTEFHFISFTDLDYNYNTSSSVSTITSNSTTQLLTLPLPPYPTPIHSNPSAYPSNNNELGITYELNIPYTVFEILVAICAVVGNLMVIVVFQRERKLRRRTNYYIVSLAMADFLVGSLGVPFAILASIGLPTNLYACLFTVSLLVVLCTISIFCLVAVSIDRYWAILYPMAYSRNVRTRTAIGIISMCWLAGCVVGFLPLFGWHAAQDEPQHGCLFVEVMDYNYLVFLYFATIITPALLMLAFYAHIYKVIIKQVRQIVTMNPKNKCNNINHYPTKQLPPNRHHHHHHRQHGGTMLRVLGAARKRDVKATQNLSVIVLFFMICWIPLYTINCIKAFCPSCDVHPKLTLFCIILSHLNSAVNPVLYAYHLKDFRLALKNLLLRLFGIEVVQPLDTLHRYSLASQPRLQSLEINARHLQPRIYIDSPIWLRQQQQQQQQQQILKNVHLMQNCNREKIGSGLVAPCLSNMHQTMMAVTAVTTDLDKQAVWNVMNASTNYNEISSKELGTPPPFRSDDCGSPYSYDNKNYALSADEMEFELPLTKRKHSSSDYAINYKMVSCNSETYYATPPLTHRQLEKLHETYKMKQLPKSSFDDCLNDSRAFISTKDTKALSTGHRPKLKKSSPAHYSANNDSNNKNINTSVQSICCQQSPPSAAWATDSNPSLNLSPDIISKINYYTLKQRPSRSQEKFSPFGDVGQLLMQPLVKHSSLFQLFHTDHQTKQINETVQAFTSVGKNSQELETTDCVDTTNALNMELTSSRRSDLLESPFHKHVPTASS